MWSIVLASLAHADGPLVPVQFNPCPPFGSCHKTLRAIDGVYLPWQELQVQLEEGPVEPNLLRVTLELDRGLVELWVDGVWLNPRLAEEVRLGTFVWYVPVDPEGYGLLFESASVGEELSQYRVSVEGLTEGP